MQSSTLSNCTDSERSLNNDNSRMKLSYPLNLAYPGYKSDDGNDVSLVKLLNIMQPQPSRTTQTAAPTTLHSFSQSLPDFELLTIDPERCVPLRIPFQYGIRESVPRTPSKTIGFFFPHPVLQIIATSKNHHSQENPS